MTTPNQVKTFDATKLAVDDRAKIIRTVLINMVAQVGGNTNAGVLLAGDPGTGKTSLARQISQIVGMPLITVEVPLLLEEHIINIPFIKYTPHDNKSKTHVVKGKQTGDMTVELAQSNLMLQLRNSTIVSDDELLDNLYSGKYGKNVIRLFERLGGSKNEIPAFIKQVRSRFTNILFLDEYFRRTSGNIRNMLRSILNRKLGLDDLPKNVYVLFASNIDDDGVEDIPHNNQFRLATVKRPSKESWLSYTLDRAEQYGYKISEEVSDIFDAVVQDSADTGRPHPNKIWGTNDVNISPRRLEQIMLYTQASLDVKNKKSAQSAYTNLMLNFKNSSGEISTSGEMFGKRIVAEIKKKIPDFEPAFNAPTAWRDTLHHQLTRSMLLGPLRTYIPTISGTFGIGKTTELESIKNSMKLGLIVIDCSNYSAEDVTGVPIPSTDENGNHSVYFAESKLEKFIREEAAKVKPEKPNSQGYNYIIFFDELNRTNTKGFNALRKVLLEREFDNGSPLPEGSLIVAAINPVDEGGGITELTAHMRDVMDIIDAEPDWNSFYNWLSNQSNNIENLELEESIREVLVEFAKQFSIESGTPGFFLNLSSSEDIYMSPREFTQIFAEASIALDMTFEQLKNQYQFTGMPKRDDLAACDLALREDMADSVLGVVAGILEKYKIEAPLDTLETWFTDNPDASILNKMQHKEIETSLTGMYSHIQGTKGILAATSEIEAYLKNSSPEKVVSDIEDYLTTQPVDKLVEKVYPLRNAKAGDITETGKSIGLATFLYRELFIAIYDIGVQSQLEDAVKKSSANLLNKIVQKHQLTDDVFAMLVEMSEEMYYE